MRVLALMTDAYGGHGGIAKFNRDLLDALAEMPEVTQVVALPRQVQMAADGVPGKVDYRCQAAGGKRAYVMAALKAAAGSYDLLICGHINLLRLAVAVNLKVKAPLVLVAHGIDVWQAHGSHLTRRLLGMVTQVWAVSRYTRDAMRRWAGIDESRFAILPNCIDLDRFQPGPGNPQMAARWSLHNRTVLLTLARLAGRERYKGVDEVLNILPRLVRHRADLCFVIAGDGNDRARLERKAQELGVSEHVVFTGFVDEQEKVDLYRLADLFVMPGRGEGFGIVYLEALACGVPVVASMLDGSREAVLDGEIGRLADPRDAYALIDVILAGLQDPHGVPEKLHYFARPRFQARVATATRQAAGTAAAMRADASSETGTP